MCNLRTGLLLCYTLRTCDNKAPFFECNKWHTCKVIAVIGKVLKKQNTCRNQTLLLLLNYHVYQFGTGGCTQKPEPVRGAYQ